MAYHYSQHRRTISGNLRATLDGHRPAPQICRPPGEALRLANSCLQVDDGRYSRATETRHHVKKAPFADGGTQEPKSRSQHRRYHERMGRMGRKLDFTSSRIKITRFYRRREMAGPGWTPFKDYYLTISNDPAQSKYRVFSSEPGWGGQGQKKLHMVHPSEPPPGARRR